MSITYSIVSTLQKYQHPLLFQLWPIFTMKLIVFSETKLLFSKEKKIYFIVALILSRHQSNACVFALFLTFFFFYFVYIFHSSSFLFPYNCNAISELESGNNIQEQKCVRYVVQIKALKMRELWLMNLTTVAHQVVIVISRQISDVNWDDFTISKTIRENFICKAIAF